MRIVELVNEDTDGSAETRVAARIHVQVVDILMHKRVHECLEALPRTLFVAGSNDLRAAATHIQNLEVTLAEPERAHEFEVWRSVAIVEKDVDVRCQSEYLWLDGEQHVALLARDPPFGRESEQNPFHVQHRVVRRVKERLSVTETPRLRVQAKPHLATAVSDFEVFAAEAELLLQHQLGWLRNNKQCGHNSCVL